MNSALCLSETEAVLASTRSTSNTNAALNASCESPCCPQLRATRSHVLHQPVVPVATLQPIFQSLLVQLSQLLVRNFVSIILYSEVRLCQRSN